MSSPVLPTSPVAPLPSASPSKKDDTSSPSDVLSSFPSPGRGVFSLPYQEFYVQQAREMQQGREKKVKEKKYASALDLPFPAQLEDTAATNGHENGAKPAAGGGDGAVHGKHQVWDENGKQESEDE